MKSKSFEFCRDGDIEVVIVDDGCVVTIRFPAATILRQMIEQQMFWPVLYHDQDSNKDNPEFSVVTEACLEDQRFCKVNLWGELDAYIDETFNPPDRLEDGEFEQIRMMRTQFRRLDDRLSIYFDGEEKK